MGMTNMRSKENFKKLNRVSLASRSAKGFTLIEAVVGLAIFGILAMGVIGVFSALSQSVKASRVKIILSSTAASYLEVMRNLPYSQVGTVNGNPSGSLPDQANAQVLTLAGVQYQLYYEVTYTDDPADGTILLGTDSFPNDYKQVKMFMQNSSNGVITSFTTNVAPKGLEGLNNAGALSVTVFNSSGQPVPNASVSITNTTLVPNIILSRTTDANGVWIEVGLPNSVNSYHIVATKSGYSSDQTYPITVGNPNPVKTDATISNGLVTQISFSIDLVANLTINTQDSVCQPVSGINLNISGTKLIGVSPNVLKYNQNSSSVSGQIVMNSIEWDTYVPTLLTGQSVMVYGSSPIQQITVLPAANQVFTLILGPATTNSLLVIVKNAASSLPLEGATVSLHKNSPSQDFSGTTGGSVWTQNNWTGGGGQTMFTEPNKFFVKDDQVDILTTPTALRLRNTAGTYAGSGDLESSTFDSGTASTDYTTLTWAPTSQNPLTAAKFQIATNNNNSTWNYLGPDGTASTFYTVPGTTINPVHDNSRYIRYKVFLSGDTTATPVITSVNINYVAGCFTPGQTIFPGLSAGNDYELTVSLSGYQTTSVNNLNINGNQTIEILLSP